VSDDLKLFLSACGTPRVAAAGHHRSKNVDCLLDAAGLGVLARAVRQARKRTGRTMNAIARQAGVNFHTLQGIEEGQRSAVSNKIIRSLCRVLDLDASRWIPRDQINE